MNLVSENIQNFKRGLGSKESLGIGLERFKGIIKFFRFWRRHLVKYDLVEAYLYSGEIFEEGPFMHNAADLLAAGYSDYKEYFVEEASKNILYNEF